MRILIAAIGLASLLSLASGLWIPAKAWLAQALLSQAWSRTQIESQASNEGQKPWPWADTWPVAKLYLPDQNEGFIVLHGADGASLPFGPGHLAGSAPPGQSGTVIIAGHRDTHFRILESLQLGDPLVLESPDRSRRRYRITEIDVVDSDQTRLNLGSTRDRLVLVTCFPFNSLQANGPLRYVVTARALTEV